MLDSQIYCESFLAVIIHLCVCSLEAQAQAAQEESDSVNRKRKQEHVNAGQQLARMGEKYSDLVRQNHVIALECYKLDRKIKKLRSVPPATNGTGSSANGTAGAGAGSS